MLATKQDQIAAGVFDLTTTQQEAAKKQQVETAVNATLEKMEPIGEPTKNSAVAYGKEKIQENGEEKGEEEVEEEEGEGDQF